MLNIRKIWFLLSLAMMPFFAGCVNDDMLPDCPSEEEKPAGNVYIRLQMNLNSDGPGDSRASSRADEGSTDPATPVTDPETPGTSKENAVNTVDILVVNAATDKLTYVESLNADQINKMLTAADGAVVPIFAAQGQAVKIYAAVNMTEAMRRTFVIGAAMSDLTISSTGSSYWDVINEFVPGSNGKQTELEAAGGCIPMTGRFKITDKNFETEGDDVITISGEHFTEDNSLFVKASVSRIVAKVHVLAECPGLTDMHLDVKYVNAKDAEAEYVPGNEFANWIGWIRLDNVRYFMNGTNKSTYIFPQSNGIANQYALKDLNMDLFRYRNGRRFTGFEDDFMYYSGMALHKENISAQSHFSQVEEYNKTTLYNTKANSDVEDRYTAGQYCAENYFTMPDVGSENDLICTERKDAIPMITHLSIAAKLTPRSIVVKKDYKDNMNAFVKDFVDNPETFYRKYGLKPTDFTDSDADRWNNTIKDRYFKNVTDESVYRNEFLIIKTASEADAADIINWSLMGNKLWSGDDADFERSKYPASTFFVYDTQYDGEQAAGATWNQRYLYLTAGAVNAAKDDNAKIKTYSVPHVGGWGYYYTYLDQLNQAVNDKVPPYRASQVTRNTYYIVTVSNFGYPGGSITRPEFIKVNTVPVGWDYVGRGHVNLH